MRKNSKTNKALSIVLSVLMVLGMLPVMAFVSTAATAPAYAGGGEWLHYGSDFNSNYTSLNSKGGLFYTSMAIPVTNYYFMQTEDNQIMTFTADFYACKNDTVNAMVITSLNTNVTNDEGFASALSRLADVDSSLQAEWWTNPNGYTNNFTAGNSFVSSSDGVEAKMGGIPHFTYTVNFVADGSAVYNPQWEIGFKSRGGYEWLGFKFEQHNTSNIQIETTGGNSTTINENPVFNIRVIDLREINNLIAIANSLGVNANDYTGGRDFSGATYYSQDVVDEVTAALRAALLCDYSALDSQISRAAAVEDNVIGGLGGTLFDSDLYDVFTQKYNDAKAVDRFLMEDGTGANEAIIETAADELEEAIDNLLPTRKALINYYVDGNLFAQNTVPLNSEYNFHDATDKFISTPTMEHYVFDKWVDENGDRINQNTLVTGDISAYASFVFDMEGIAPLESSGMWQHKLSPNDDDGRGDYYVTMWVKDTSFNFVQTTDNETFSFYTDLFAYKNDGGNIVRIKKVELLPDDAETTAFKELLGNREAEVYCVSENAGAYPTADDNNGDGIEDGALPGQFGNGYTTLKNNYCVDWRYTYTFEANGAGQYVPKWDITYYSANDDVLGIGSGTHTLADEDDKTGLDKYVNFTINVTDVRELINEINKAESIYNNPNSYLQFTQDDLDALRAILDFIEANYTLDGSVYYEQTVIDGLVDQIKQVIPDGTQVYCDYTELDAAIALANEKRAEYNDNADNHYINEVWNDFMTAYTAATTVDRNLYVIESNANQTMIDGLTENLLEAISALNYQTHVNQPCDYTGADDILDEANQINNDNGKYDDDAYQNFEDAKDALEDLLNLYDDEDGNNQAAIDQAVQDLQDAIDALSDTNNQNDPCDYSALNDAIAAAQSITDSELFDSQTYQDLQDALAAAENIPTDLYDNGTNQTTIDTATDALVDAINALLTNAITNAQNVSTDGMDSTTVGNLDTAIDAAEDVAADQNASAQDKADAINGITDAVDNLAVDKNDLEIAIYSAGLIDTTDLPQNLVDALDAAVSNGQLVYNDPDASVAGVADATDQIRNAIADILQQVINDASNTDTTGMTTNTIQDLEDAIDNAQAIHDDSNSNAYTLAETIADVQDAVDSLEPDKQPLEDAIAAAESVDTSNLPQNLADALDDAITNGNNVDNDDDATVSDIADAINQIEDALENILQQIIDDANNTDTSGMTPESIQDLQDAIDAAEDVLNDPDATAEDIANAITDIQNTVDGLAPDKTELEETISLAQSIDTASIDPVSVQNLEDAITAAQAVDDDDDATVTEIETATDALKDAIDRILQDVLNDAENTDTTGMTPVSASNLENAIQNAQDVINNPDSTTQEKVDAINDLTNAVNSLNPDKTELEDAIDVAETIDTTGLPTDLADALEDAIDAGKDVDNDPDATVPEIAGATDAINDAIDDILNKLIEDAENTDKTGMDPTTVQELEDAIQNAKDVVNDPDSTPQDKVDAINDIKNAVDGLTVDKTDLAEEIIKGQDKAVDPRYLQDDNIDALEDAISDAQDVYNNPDATAADVAQAIQAIEDAIANLVEIHELIPTAEGGLAVDRDDTECYYLVGLDVNDTSFANVKSKFKNDGRQIIAFRGETQLTDTDLIGTGCIIKCVDIDDPTIVYEQAVVILYGDITGDEGGYGDGLVNDTDYTALKGDAFFGAGNIVADSVFFYAADLDGDKALDAFDCFFLDGIATGGRYFDQKVELYK